MADNDDKMDQLDLLRTLPTNDATEKIDALWQQIMTYKFADGDLSEARSRRAQA